MLLSVSASSVHVKLSGTSSSISRGIQESKGTPALRQSTSHVYVESPTFTGSSYIASAYKLNLPTDLSTIISGARKEKKSLDIYAVDLHITSSLYFSGIPRVRIFAATCHLDRSYITLHNSAHRGTTPRHPVPVPGRTPTKPRKAPNAGKIEVICSHIEATTSTTVSFYAQGSYGFYGGRGGSGLNGRDGTPGRRGRCKSKKFLGIRIKCDRTSGSRGVYSTNGSDGARGGPGGDGGDGGRGFLTYGSLGAHKVTFRHYTNGGNGAPGGYGGAAGKNGKYIPNIQYVTGCRSKCRENLQWESRPALTTRRSGSRGVSGSKGRNGLIFFSRYFYKYFSSLSNEDFLRYAALCERYYNDMVVAEKDCKKAAKAMDSIIWVARWAPTSKLMQAMKGRADVAKDALRLRKTLFGPATLSRIAPTPIGTELARHLKYTAALRDAMSVSRLERNLLGAIVETAAISIPGTNYAELRSHLTAQRDVFKHAVLDIENRLTLASDIISVEVERKVLANRDEAERKRKAALFKAVMSIGQLAVGVFSLKFDTIIDSAKDIVGVIKDVEYTFDDIKESFGEIGNATEGFKGLLEFAFDVPDKIKTIKDGFTSAGSTACKFDDVKHLLLDSPDRIDKFPNLVDLDADFSKIYDLGVVNELSQALLKTRANELTAQIGCVLQEKLSEIPNVESAFKNFWTLSAARLDVLARMVDLDIELKHLSVYEAGVDAQKAQLDLLRTNSGVRTKSNALSAMSIQFEGARMATVEIVERLATSYGNLALRDMFSDIKTYANTRLNLNGFLGSNPLSQYANLVRLENNLKNRFRTAQRCLTLREVPSVSYYSFDITKEDNPEVFEEGVKTGPNHRTSLYLDIRTDCAIYAGNTPPPRNLTDHDSRPHCVPNLHTYNARMVSVGVELIGGDTSLLPAGRRSVFMGLDQVGSQLFHGKPGSFKSYNMEPLQFSLGFVPLAGATGPLQYHETCHVSEGKLGSVDLDSPRVCPSAFSNYALQIGHVQEAGLHTYLSSVKAIRVHTRMVAFTRHSTASICFT